MRIKRIHHVTIAVRDLEGARLTFEQLFGAQGERAVDVPAFGIRAVDVPMGGDVLQLASPVAGDNPVVRFLERRGEGFYNLALEIEDLDDTVRELASQGVRVSEPIELEPGVRSAFVTMAATHGLSVQLVEVPQSVGPSVDPSGGGGASQQVGISAGEPKEEIGVLADDEPQADDATPPPLLDLTPDEWSDVD
jgi:catechol 2,3-dioxygenase-like lactoylglutathione lyase family enzyme